MITPNDSEAIPSTEHALRSVVSESHDDHGAGQGQRRHDDASDDRKRCTGPDPDDCGHQREVKAAKGPRRDIDWCD